MLAPLRLLQVLPIRGGLGSLTALAILQLPRQIVLSCLGSLRLLSSLGSIARGLLAGWLPRRIPRLVLRCFRLLHLTSCARLSCRPGLGRRLAGLIRL